MIAQQLLPIPVTEVIPAFRRVTPTTGGVRLADVEAFIGTNVEDRSNVVPGRDIASIQPVADGFHFATIGNATAIAAYDEIEAYADGKVVKKTTGVAIGRALEAAGSSSTGGVIRVIYYPHANPGAKQVIAAGIHTWAGGAATTDSIAVEGLEATDTVICSLAAVAGAEVLKVAANDAANDQIDLTLSANGTNGTTKVHYMVLR